MREGDDGPWWRRFPRESRLRRSAEPSDPAPLYGKGDRVRLAGKPDRVRAVLEVEWHGHRHQYCYRLETSTKDRGLWEPSYWFADQLVPARE